MSKNEHKYYSIKNVDDLKAVMAKEGNEKVWQSKAGLLCAIYRHPKMGHLCGYVGVPKTHPYYGKGYDDVERLEREKDDEAKSISVHGGLTFADFHPKYKEDLWFFGFDCGHFNDVSLLDFITPSYARGIGALDNRKYRTMEYVTDECESLAEQLSNVE